MASGGFVDLRIEHRAHADTDAGIWPSFTDIMTVIVLVFLLSLVVIMLNNVRLQEVLKSSMTAEQAAVAENLSLIQRLSVARDQLAAARSNAISLADQLETLRRHAAELARSREAALEEQARLSDLASDHAAKLAARVAELRALEAETERLNIDRARLIEQRTEQAAALDSLQTQLLLLQGGISERELQITELLSSAEISDQQIAELQERYATLDSEYQALVGLARSDVGKYVAEVHFSKLGEQYTYALQLPDEAVAQPLGRAVLETRLGALKNEHGNDLYVRIIIPDESPLSHNEAWTFTEEMLGRYDYYYQE